MTVEEQRLSRTLGILSAVFALMAAGYVGQGIWGNAEFPFVANSVAKDGLFSALCIAGAADLRRNGWAVHVVIWGHILLLFGLLVMLVAGDISTVEGSFADPGIGLYPEAETIFWLWLVLCFATLVYLRHQAGRAARSRYRLRFLSQAQHRTVMALAEVLVEPEEDEVELLTPEEIAGSVDEYLFELHASGKRRVKLALTGATLYPMLRLRPPLPLMSPAKRRAFVERCFVSDVAERRLPGPIRRAVQSMLVAIQQLVFIAYWSDERTAGAAGFEPFSERVSHERAEALGLTAQVRPGVVSLGPQDIDGETRTAEVVIVGTGAAGSILADRLTAAGRDVLMLERGRHVTPGEFTENERDMFSELYADGAVQLARDARFQVLQGMCVGGTTVVNNAVCFDLPDRVLKRWNRPDGLNADLEKERLDAAFTRLRAELPVLPQGGGAAPFQGGAAAFVDGCRKLGYDRPPHDFGAIEANIEGCLGCGYCNYGCRYGKKLSMLERVLPQAQARNGKSGSLEILAECDARRVVTDGERATGVECLLADGRKVLIEAESVVISAGAIGSSLLLQRSGIRGDLAGNCVSFNMGAPMTAEFDDRLASYDGLQITHHLQPAGEEGLILETWFNPVGCQALFMPGWFSDHWHNMRRYDRMASVGSVVGTRSNARVRNPRWLRPWVDIQYEPHPDDLAQLVRGLKMIGRILLEAGAKRVMPSTFRYIEVTREADLDELDRHIRDNTDISLHSSHPQGGNPVSADPAKGVVAPDFRVHGFENLHLCDASAFPSSITVNPQLTVMALADVAADALIP